MSKAPTCEKCGEPVKPHPSVLYAITGYERERLAGGTNQVVGRKRTGKIVGACCADSVRNGRR